jgi:hypothetical protein
VNIKKFVLRTFEIIAPARRLNIVQSDSLPGRLPVRWLVLARDDGEDWCVGLRCPCGCGRTIELLLLPDVKPRWDLETDDVGRPSLNPSIWLQDGCKSHFWIRQGRVQWCE